MDNDNDPVYANIRDILGAYIGKKIVDITQHDEAEFQAGLESYLILHFEDGSWIKFFINNAGFLHGDGDGDPDEVRMWRREQE